MYITLVELLMFVSLLILLSEVQPFFGCSALHLLMRKRISLAEQSAQCALVSELPDAHLLLSLSPSISIIDVTNKKK